MISQFQGKPLEWYYHNVTFPPFFIRFGIMAWWG